MQATGTQSASGRQLPSWFSTFALSSVPDVRSREPGNSLKEAKCVIQIQWNLCPDHCYLLSRASSHSTSIFFFPSESWLHIDFTRFIWLFQATRIPINKALMQYKTKWSEIMNAALWRPKSWEIMLSSGKSQLTLSVRRKQEVFGSCLFFLSPCGSLGVCVNVSHLLPLSDEPWTREATWKISTTPCTTSVGFGAGGRRTGRWRQAHLLVFWLSVNKRKNSPAALNSSSLF